MFKFSSSLSTQENEDINLRMACVDYALRLTGVTEKTLTSVAQSIYDFAINKKTND